jgi:aromatic ring-cleaving dioxygenase
MTDAITHNVMIDGYHGHVYYTAETRLLAERLRDTIAGTFGIEVRGLSRSGPTLCRNSALHSPRNGSTPSCRG